MAITYIGCSSAMDSGSNTAVVDVPVGYVAGDILFLIMYSGLNLYSSDIPSGWVDAGGGRTRTCYKYASASESSVTIANSGTTISGIMLCFRGVASKLPIGGSGYGNTSGSSYVSPTITTSVDGCMVITAVGFMDYGSPDITNFSGWTNSDLDSITEGYDEFDSSSTGIAFAYGIKSTAGAVKATTATADMSDNYSNTAVIALKPLPSVNVSATIPLSTITNAELIIPAVSTTRVVDISAPLSTIFSRTEYPSVSVTRVVDVSIPLSTVSSQMKDPSVSTEISVSVQIPLLSNISSEFQVLRIFYAVFNPLMTIDSLGNLTVRGIIKIGSIVNLDMFGNLTVAELIIGDKFSLSADGKLTVKSITEGMD